ncbi:MgtC/SapB family protein [Sphingomonas arenae]|uniref:MgtC/SapB family protein n=1 Tax=Sphingomonas arenae TaxID=2812555 RepID=UPI00196812F8|nr:MgtC/SapB family protein [Sphingomonas arenae]
MTLVALASGPLLPLGAAFAAGLMLGVQRGWQQRDAAEGSRVAGVRTFALLGGAGGLASLIGQLIHPMVTAVLAAGLIAPLIIGYAREPRERSVTNLVAGVIAVALGLLACSGQPALAVAAGAVTTALLAARQRLHGLIERLDQQDVQAFARYAVIVAAILPFLPNRNFGPYDDWNPFQLWLVVVLVTGFSFAGYIANRIVGERKGTLATALIGGAYSSTAVTASLSQRLGAGEAGPYSAGIAIASAVMYVRVILLLAVLSPSTLPSFLLLVGPAALTGAAVAWWLWRRAPGADAGGTTPPGNPIEILPALGFVAIVAAGAVFTRWAQERFGESGIALSLFLTGSFDVDASIVTLSQLPVGAIARNVAALAIAGTIVANMLLKIGVALAYSRARGRPAAAALMASTAVLVGMMALGWSRL